MLLNDHSLELLLM